MNGWKVTAIIFIVLFVLESAFVIWAWQEGTTQINNEVECAYNICEDAETYYYDTYDETCSCYTDNELVRTRYLG